MNAVRRTSLLSHPPVNLGRDIRPVPMKTGCAGGLVQLPGASMEKAEPPLEDQFAGWPGLWGGWWVGRWCLSVWSQD